MGFSYNFVPLHDTKELRELIEKHPDWPICIEVGEDANPGEYSYTVCARFSARAGEILDTEAICNDEIIYADRDMFEDDMANWLIDAWDEIDAYKDLDVKDDKVFDKALKAEIAKYDKDWKDCIVLTVGN